MLRAARIRGDVRQVHLRLLTRGKLDLRLLRRLLQPLQGQRIVVQIDSGFPFELVGEVVDDPKVEVLATQEGVSVRGQHLELVLAVDLGDLDDRDVERAAAEVIDRDLRVSPALVHPVCERRGRRLVDDPLDVEARNPPRILRRLSLRVVEVRRDGDDRLLDIFVEVVVRGLLHLQQHPRGDLRRRHPLALRFDPCITVVRAHDPVRHHAGVALNHLVVEPPADEALDREQGVLRIRHRLALRRLPHQHLVVLAERDDGRRGAIAFAVLDDSCRASIHDRHARIGRA